MPALVGRVAAGERLAERAVVAQTGEAVLERRPPKALDLAPLGGVEPAAQAGHTNGHPHCERAQGDREGGHDRGHHLGLTRHRQAGAGLAAVHIHFPIQRVLHPAEHRFEPVEPVHGADGVAAVDRRDHRLGQPRHLALVGDQRVLRAESSSAAAWQRCDRAVECVDEALDLGAAGRVAGAQVVEGVDDLEVGQGEPGLLGRRAGRAGALNSLRRVAPRVQRPDREDAYTEKDEDGERKCDGGEARSLQERLPGLCGADRHRPTPC